MVRHKNRRIVCNRSLDGKNVGSVGTTMDGFQRKNVHNLFAAVNTLKLPDVETPKKSLKEQKLEEAKERAKRIKEHEQRFEQDTKNAAYDFVNDDLFMGREEESKDVDVCVSSTNIYEDDWNSLKIFKEPEIAVETTISRLEELHAPRPKVKWSSEVLRKLKADGKILQKYQSLRNIVRHPDYSYRLNAAELADTRHQRYSTEDIKDMEKGRAYCDYFKLFQLLPQQLQPIKKTITDINGTERFITPEALEKLVIKKKLGLIEKLHEMTCSDHKNDNPKVVAAEKRFAELNDKLEKLELMVSAGEQEVEELVKKCDSLPDMIEESRKRKLSEPSEPSDSAGGIVVPVEGPSSEKGINEEPRWKREQREEEQRRIERKKRLMEEKKRKSDEDRKRKEKESMEKELKRKAEQEEEDRKFQAALEEKRKRLQKEEEEECERLRQVEEERLRLKLLEHQKEKARRAAEKKARDERETEELRRILVEKQKAVDLEQKKKEGEASGTDDSLTNIEGIQRIPIILQASWNFLKAKQPDDWRARKEVYFNRIQIPTDDAHRMMEHEEDVKKIGERTILNKKPSIIPQENTSKTIVHSIIIPKAVKKKNEVKEVTPNRILPAVSTITSKMVNQRLSAWIRKKRPVPAPYSLRHKEIVYKNINLQDLKSIMMYPFHPSDGMYWPVFFGAPNFELSTHVKLLVTCNSFSGKYASHLLLTSSHSEDNLHKKFDENYADSDGYWDEYSRKPGRFSNRKGFSAEKSKCSDSFEEQKNRAVRANRDAYEREKMEMEQFERSSRDFESAGDVAKYTKQYTVRLAQLVKDSRLDMYSQKNSSTYADRDAHPGTRDSPIEPRWHNHGYTTYLRRRDVAYGDLMNSNCKSYEYLLPSIEDSDEFEEWALAPMLASIYYQASYNVFQVHSTEEQKAMEARRTAYMEMLTKKKFSLKQALEICKVTRSDKEQWTILYDQLVSHFRDFPSISTHLYCQKSSFHECAKRAVEEVMATVCKHISNRWDFDVDSS